MQLLSTTALLSLAALTKCQGARSEWPQDAESANQGPGRYNFTLEIPLTVFVSL